MKAILSLRRHHYLRTIGGLLIAMVLVAGVLSCTTPAVKYDLTMAVNPAGAGNATDERGTSPYFRGTVVNITAVAAPWHAFLNWTAPAGTFGNSTAAATQFTMPAQDVTVTANFVEVYSLKLAGPYATDLTNASPYPAGTVVSLTAEHEGLCYECDCWTCLMPWGMWTAPAGTFGDPYAVETTFIMPAQNVTVTANWIFCC